MCGIVGCLNLQGKAMTSVVSALNKLQNRGYDSAGICTVNDRTLVHTKDISTDNRTAMDTINKSELIHNESRIAVGHTRWATHGAKTIENCHPHFDSENRYALVHNGIIENYQEIKEMISDCYGQTDSEVVVKYFSRGGFQIFDDLKGSWAILILDANSPNHITVAKNGSPLLMGLNDSNNKLMLVSEMSGFDADINRYAVIPDNTVTKIEILDDMIVFPNYPLSSVNNTHTLSSPEPYPYWILKEIYDQPDVISNVLTTTFEEIDINPDHVILLACGTSYHAAQVGALWMRKLGARFTTQVIDGADFEAHDLIENRNNLLILISQSGETRDLYRALQIGKEHNVRSIGIVNVENSLIARDVDRCLYLKAGCEHAVASTKSFTAQVTMLLMLSMHLTGNRDEMLIKAINTLSSDIDKAIDSCENIEEIVNHFDDQTDCFILGKHVGEWIAKEGALKVKEISYVHAEGYSASALKHGPFALLTHKVPVIVMCSRNQYYPKMISTLNEIKSRHSTVIVITNTDIPSDICDYVLKLDVDSTLFDIISVIPLQLLAYHLALRRGHNPDYPRNLAKVVTVE